jgi:hypothetical protein
MSLPIWLVACWYSASTYALETSTSDEATKLLIESERIQGDLQQYVSGSIKQDFNVVIREFRRFDVSHEFRGFIHKRKLTALTQYNGTG